MIERSIKQLVEYGISKNLITSEDRIYTTNILIDMLALDTYEEPGDVPAIETPQELEQVLKTLLDYAVEKGLIETDSVVLRDLFDTKLMNVLVPKPSQVIQTFWDKYRESPKVATDYYYSLSKATDYIRTYRIEKDMKWVTPTEYGALDITINLSKPEKDPKMIALAGSVKSSSYPKCLLCIENEGYAGTINHPARQNHRIIPIEINGSRWGFQYSPYVYYNEHCIVFNGEHVPMKINRDTFAKLFDFIKLFPHYFVGSNADLPIVGGSILSHDHFQGGNYEFAMAKAPIEKEIRFHGYEDVHAGIVKWPMSVIRLNGEDSDRLIELSDSILHAWRAYTDEAAYIYAETDGEKHNTITPIARMRDGRYEIDLVLRNNITTKEHPMGLYHPWEEYHHIKKENIGLIEVMGLAVLPARLKGDIEEIKNALLEKKDLHNMPNIEKHANWVNSFIDKYDTIDAENVERILQDEIGKVFKSILECAGVYKQDEAGQTAFLRFIEYVNKVM
ncbi:MAG: UDP-glucose--hexose-1-phosphate uridylyltransferase [Lachnospiraceae bacterium]|nr:UDP-glucose--hexose-1-phosphate uridylyltransferase [Lachnospiraceae bacterium]